MLQLPAALCSRRFPASGGAAQTIKPQTEGVTPARVIPGQRGRSVKDVPEAQSGPSPLRAQAPAHFVLGRREARGPGCRRWRHRAERAENPAPDGGLPQSLLLLPALPAVQAADAEDHHQCQRYRGFPSGCSHVLCSWRRVCRGDWLWRDDGK